MEPTRRIIHITHHQDNYIFFCKVCLIWHTKNPVAHVFATSGAHFLAGSIVFALYGTALMRVQPAEWYCWFSRHCRCYLHAAKTWSGLVGKKRRGLGILGQKKLNSCWGKGSWMDGHKTWWMQRSIYTPVVTLISSPPISPLLIPSWSPLLSLPLRQAVSAPQHLAEKNTSLLASWAHPPFQAVSPCQLPSRPPRGW